MTKNYSSKFIVRGILNRGFTTTGSCLTFPLNNNNLPLDDQNLQDGSNVNSNNNSSQENLSSNRNSITSNNSADSQEPLTDNAKDKRPTTDNSPYSNGENQEPLSDKAKGKRRATDNSDEEDNGGPIKKPRLDNDDSDIPTTMESPVRNPSPDHTFYPRSGNSNPSSSDSPSSSSDDGYRSDSNRSYFEEGADAMVNYPVADLPEDQLRRYIEDTDDIQRNPHLAGLDDDSDPSNAVLRQQWADRNSELRQELTRRMDEGLIPRDNGGNPTDSSSLTTTVPGSTSTVVGPNSANTSGDHASAANSTQDNRSPLDFVLDKQSSEPLDVFDTED